MSRLDTNIFIGFLLLFYKQKVNKMNDLFYLEILIKSFNHHNKRLGTTIELLADHFLLPDHSIIATLDNFLRGRFIILPKNSLDLEIYKTLRRCCEPLVNLY